MSIDEQLRAALRDERLNAPQWPDPVSRVEAGIGRRRRRRLAAQAAGVATVAVIALAMAVFQPHSPGTPGDSATIDATTDEPRSTAPFMRRTSPRPDRAACPVEALGEIEWIVQSAPWGYSTGFGLRNNRDQRCTLRGTPTLFAVDVETGARVPVPVAEPPSKNDTKARQFPATLDPGELARVEIDGQSSCAPSQTPRSYRDLVLVHEGHEFRVPTLRKLDNVCGASVSPWFVEPSLEFAPLVVSLDAPTSLQRGTDFTYTVKVLNASPRTYRVPACPAYQLSLAAAQGEWRTLNCRITEIEPHETVYFRLRGHIPADAATGETKLTWMAVMDDGEVAVADMQTSGFKVTVW